jgi:hypothetical protein
MLWYQKGCFGPCDIEKCWVGFEILSFEFNGWAPPKDVSYQKGYLNFFDI